MTMGAPTISVSAAALTWFLIEASLRAGAILVAATMLSSLVHRCSAAKGHLFWSLSALPHS